MVAEDETTYVQAFYIESVGKKYIHAHIPTGAQKVYYGIRTTWSKTRKVRIFVTPGITDAIKVGHRVNVECVKTNATHRWVIYEPVRMCWQSQSKNMPQILKRKAAKKILPF